jgi:rubrerythrin
MESCEREKDPEFDREVVIKKLRARVAELEATITTMQDEADIVQIGTNRRWDLLEDARTNFYRMAEKIHQELYHEHLENPKRA